MESNSQIAKNIIEFRDVAKVYPGNLNPSLSSVSFSVSEGELFILVGPSGCGKSTILKIIAGLENESEGAVVKPNSVSMVFQSGALFPWLNVFDNVALGLRELKFHEKKVQDETLKYVEMVGLTEFIEKFPRDLSGGQKQRVGLARALAVNPDVLLLDEPFSALDTATTEEMHRDLIKIWQSTKKTIVMVSHSIEEAVSLADRVMLMKNGQVKQLFEIKFPYPRREQAHNFIEEVHKIRNQFFK